MGWEVSILEQVYDAPNFCLVHLTRTLTDQVHASLGSVVAEFNFDVGEILWQFP